MPAVGPRLRTEREKRDLRLVDVAMATKVGAHHLSALEYGDFSGLPDNSSVLEFVRLYAEHLGLDPDATVADCARELEAERPAGSGEAETEAESDSGPDAPSVTPADRPRFGLRLILFAAALIVVLALLGWWWIAGGAAEEEPVLPAEPGAAASEEMPDARNPVGTVPAMGTVQAPVDSAPAENDTVPALAPEPEDGISRLTATEYGVGTGVVDRRLVGESVRFAEGQQVWFWTRVSGGAAGETIRHVWIHDGRETASIPLTLGGPHWRTQSRKILTPGSSGRWAVEARDAAGRVLARSEFVCPPRS